MSVSHANPSSMGPSIRWCRAPARRPCPASPSSPCNPSSTDVTPPRSPSTTPTYTPPPLDDIVEDPEYDQISDQSQVEQELLCFVGDPLAIRRHAMAADFSEGRLETFVGSPQKELAGTQNQYISYQVTTKVGTASYTLAAIWRQGRRRYADEPRLVELPVLPEARVHRPAPLYRFCLPIQTVIERISAMCRPTVARQAQDGIRARRPLRTRLHAKTGPFTAPLPQASIFASGSAASYACHQLPREPRLEPAHEGPIVADCQWVGAGQHRLRGRAG